MNFGIDFDGGVIIGIVEKSIGILRERERESKCQVLFMITTFSSAQSFSLSMFFLLFLDQGSKGKANNHEKQPSF